MRRTAAWTVLNFFVGAFILASFTPLASEIYARLGPPLSTDLVQKELHEGEPANARNWSPTRIMLATVLAAAVALLAMGASSP